jgi:hypothetical protein
LAPSRTRRTDQPWFVSIRISGQIIGAPATTATRRSVIFSPTASTPCARSGERVEIVVSDEAVGEDRAGGAGGRGDERSHGAPPREQTARLTAGFIVAVLSDDLTGSGGRYTSEPKRKKRPREPARE